MGPGGSAIRLCAAAKGIKKMINTPKIYKMRIVFRLSANAPARADIVGALRHMVQTSNLPYASAKQNPRAVRLNYGPSVKRGQWAEREYADIYLRKSVGVAQVRAQLENSKPQGFTLLEVYRVPYNLPAVQQLGTVGVFRAEGNFAAYAPKETFENYVTAARLEVVRQAANGMNLSMDIKPFVVGGKTLSPQGVELTLQSVADKWLSPLVVLYGWLGLPIPMQDDLLTAEGFTVTRLGLYWQDSAGELHLI